MQLFSYQTDCIGALWKFWNEKPEGAPLLVCPTGSGKSYICASIIQRILEKYPRFRFLVATHTKEIVSQNSRELQALMPKEAIGIYSAGLNEKNLSRRITFANIQSIYKKAANLHIDFLIIDEAHLVPKNGDAMYQKLIANLRAKNWRLRIVGLTATPMRMDQGALAGENSTFTDIAYDIALRRLIDEGYLCPLVSMSKKAVDLSEVRTSGADYNQGDLEHAFNKEHLVRLHTQAIVSAARDRKHWLVFCTGIDHAKAVSEELTRQGIPSDYVTGEMLGFERDSKIAAFRAGRIRALCNVSVLTTGFNFRPVDLIVLLRATKSAGLYIQIVGRGTRTAENKLNCLILDFGGNIKRHGPVDCITVKQKKAREKAEIVVVPYKECPVCGCCVPLRVAVCPECEYPYPEPEQDLDPAPSELPILSKVEILPVDFTEYKRHQKPGKPDSFKIMFRCGLRTFFQFLCFEHGGFPRQMACGKWFQLSGIAGSYPANVAEALERRDELRPVKALRVIKRQKHFEILSMITASPEEMKTIKAEAQAQWEKENPF